MNWFKPAFGDGGLQYQLAGSHLRYVHVFHSKKLHNMVL